MLATSAFRALKYYNKTIVCAKMHGIDGNLRTGSFDQTGLFLVDKSVFLRDSSLVFQLTYHKTCLYSFAG